MKKRLKLCANHKYLRLQIHVSNHAYGSLPRPSWLGMGLYLWQCVLQKYRNSYRCKPKGYIHSIPNNIRALHKVFAPKKPTERWKMVPSGGNEKELNLEIALKWLLKISYRLIGETHEKIPLISVIAPCDRCTTCIAHPELSKFREVEKKALPGLGDIYKEYTRYCCWTDTMYHCLLERRARLAQGTIFYQF